MTCPQEDVCPFSHSSIEIQYHPLNYKTRPCKYQHGGCNNDRFCAYVHDERVCPPFLCYQHLLRSVNASLLSLSHSFSLGACFRAFSLLLVQEKLRGCEVAREWVVLQFDALSELEHDFQLEGQHRHYISE